MTNMIPTASKCARCGQSVVKVPVPGENGGYRWKEMEPDPVPHAFMPTPTGGWVPCTALTWHYPDCGGRPKQPGLEPPRAPIDKDWSEDERTEERTVHEGGDR